MNIIDINLDDFEHQTASQVSLPRVVCANSVGHQLMELYPNIPIDLTTSHSKYLPLSEAGAITDWHVDMTGSSVFYFLAQGKKTFDVLHPDRLNLNAITTKG